MTTTANIDFFGLEICCEDNGYPETVEPYLEELRQRVIDIAKTHGLKLGQAVAVVLHDEYIDDPQERSSFARGGYSHPSFEYSVTQERVAAVSYTHLTLPTILLV